MALNNPIMKSEASPSDRKSYARLPQVLELPNFILIQLDSFKRFSQQALKELFQEISPIQDFTGSRLELTFVNPRDDEPDFGKTRCFFGNPRYSELECRLRDLTFAAPLNVTAWLRIKQSGVIKQQDIFFGDFPLMTANGTFIINGAERVVVSQLLRSPGVYFTLEEDLTSGRDLAYAKLIPDRGAWLEFETGSRDVISIKVDGRKKIPITTLLRAIGFARDEELLEKFKDVDTSPEHQYIKTTMERDPGIRNQDEALIDIYKRLRPGDPPNLDNAKTQLNNLFFNARRYDLGAVGRYKLNKRLGLNLPPAQRVLTKEDLVQIARHLILVNNRMDRVDDIDHLGNRRVRTVGELLQNQFRIGLLRLEKVARERMSIVDPETVTPSILINIRPVVAAMREFFGGSQLSQFMDQTNPLAELTHKRRLSALGPGGLSRERAGFEVRDVHYSHYGRICPIETPEGPNIGLIGSLATYARVNKYCFIETPYRRVISEVNNTREELIGRTLRDAVTTSRNKLVAEAGTVVNEEVAKALAALSKRRVKVVPSVSQEIREEDYLTADAEENYTIAQANAPLNDKNQFTEEKVEVRCGDRYFREAPGKIDFMDVSPKQIVSVATSLIPFLEHDDANRALMGSNMQRQAVPLLRPEAPLVGTGVEWKVARDSGQLITAKGENGVTLLSAGEVKSVAADEIVVSGDFAYPLTQHHTSLVKKGDEVGTDPVLAKASDNNIVKCQQLNGVVTSVTPQSIVVRGDMHYRLQKFVRTNQGTCINQRPIVSRGDNVAPEQVLADSSATEHGELALGQNVLCAFMSWEGYNFEDAIIISDNLVKRDRFSSIHIEKHEIEARDTKLGPEEITRDIPNVGEEALRELDETGIIRLGAEVQPGDILVGKITPKGETELTAEEKLLRAIFGEKAREVKDTSLRVPHGEQGKIIAVKFFSRAKGDELPAGVNQLVRVWVAQKRKVSVGDKMAGRHGNKGVVARILPAEDMPFLLDGRHVDIILNPIGVPSRMNIGQVLETHLGWVASTLGFRALSPVFDGANDQSITDGLARAWIAQRSGAVIFTPDGGSGKAVLQLESAKAWLDSREYDSAAVFSDEHPGVATRACLRLWLEEVGIESANLKDDELGTVMEKVRRERGLSPPIFGKMELRDGRTGEPFKQPVTVGSIYMMKLIHLVEDKIHARSTGPYSLITQQPLGGKAQFGGQRFGEMEVWALEAYGAAYNLQELLTVKSDDVTGRAKSYEAIVKGQEILQPGVPESFKVLVKELQSLGLAVEVLNEDEEQVTFAEEETYETPKLTMGPASEELSGNA